MQSYRPKAKQPGLCSMMVHSDLSNGIQFAVSSSTAKQVPVRQGSGAAPNTIHMTGGNCKWTVFGAFPREMH